MCRLSYVILRNGEKNILKCRVQYVLQNIIFGFFLGRVKVNLTLSLKSYQHKHVNIVMTVGLPALETLTAISARDRNFNAKVKREKSLTQKKNLRVLRLINT
jgi:hypothetical protein